MDQQEGAGGKQNPPPTSTVATGEETELSDVIDSFMNEKTPTLQKKDAPKDASASVPLDTESTAVATGPINIGDFM